MFIALHLIPDALISILQRLKIGGVIDCNGMRAPDNWMSVVTFDDTRGLIVRLPSYRHGYSINWDDFRMQQSVMVWEKNRGFQFLYWDCD